MKANRIVVLALVIGLIFAFSDTVLGDGTDPPLPPPKSKVDIDENALITGIFKARKFKQGNKYQCEVIAELKLIHSNGFETTGTVKLKLAGLISEKLICTYSLNELKKVFKAKIGADEILPKFGICEKEECKTKFILVLKKLIIKSSENCNNFDLATIHGWVEMRVKEKI